MNGNLGHSLLKEVLGRRRASLRRFRELVWIGLGLLCLTFVGGRSVVTQEDRAHDLKDGF